MPHFFNAQRASGELVMSTTLEEAAKVLERDPDELREDPAAGAFKVDGPGPGWVVPRENLLALGWTPGG